MSDNSLPRDPQKLVFAYQEALARLDEQEDRARLLLEEIDRLNHQIDWIQSSKRTETDNRLRVEEALGDTRERLQIAVEATNLVLWDFKAPFKDFFLTAKWGEILGEVALEGLWDADHLRSRVHPEDMAAIEKGLGVVMAGYKDRGVVEFRFKARDTWIWIESHGMVAQRDDQGKATWLIGTLADISQRKENERVLAQALEAADKANRAKTEFLTNISHEIRTPLNALMGLNTLLLDTTLTDDQRHWLELMSRSSQSLLKLLNDMLDLSRIEAGKLTLESAPFELRPFLDSACDLYVEQARAKDIAFVKRFARGLPQMIVGDQGRVGQVLSNLLSNAIKFTGKGGEVVLDVNVVGSGSSAQLVFLVQDSGIGIRQEVISTLFRSFTQADASIAGRYGGSGMGLAICSSLVELMHGQIRVDSKLGQGSRFWVTLPLQVPESQSVAAVPIPASEAPAESTFDGWRVLLAEDHAVNELVMRQMLVKFGCEVDVAHNGHEAVDLWQGGGYDLILMDVQMPGCNGLMASQRIRAIEASKNLPRTPIIALTANAMSGDEERCLAAGMDAYVVKPVKMELLVQVMQAARQGSVPRVASGARRPAGVDRSATRPTEQGAVSGLAGLSSTIATDLQDRMAELDQALVSKNSLLALGAAHKLKATLGLLAAERGVRLSRGLEMAANAGEWGLYTKALPLMHSEVQQLLMRLDSQPMQAIGSPVRERPGSHT